MHEKSIVEIAQFKIKPGITDEEMLKASQEAHDGFLKKHKGFISRELLKSEEGIWIDIVHWESIEDAEAAMKNFLGHPSTKKFEQIIDTSTVKMMHLRQLKKY